ncbi:MAG: trypsin-like peptidase domain-containing protein [Butyrivibrio sp.]|nr:trypsin-like peptidase domain-containing protein [Butyrivibrio sp.]
MRNILRKSVISLVAVSMMLSPISAAAAEDSATAGSSKEALVSTVESVDQAMNGVVQVNTVFDDDDGNKHIICGGAGFLIGSVEGSEYVVTNIHIADPDNDTKKAAYKFYKIPKKDGKWDDIKPYVEVVLENDVTTNASIVNSSENLDFVVLKLSQPLYNRTPLTLLVADKGATKKPYSTTDAVYGLGFPEAVSYENPVCYTNDQVTMSSGKIANVTDFEGAKLIQHNAQIGTNNCGGPLLNENGLVIGMNELSADSSNNYYSLDASDIANILTGLGVEFNAITASEYEEWLHRNDPVEVKKPEAPTQVIVKEEKHTTPAWLIIVVAVLAALVVALIVLFIVVMAKQSKKDPAKGKKPEKEKDVKIPPRSQISQMHPVQAVKNPAGNMETGVIGGPAAQGATTVLNASAPAAGEPLITSGTLIRRKNSDNIIIDKQSFSIGKDSLHVDYCITDNPAVSRTHAMINTVNNQVFLQDCHSTNGTFINNRKLADGSSEPLNNGDIIKLGDEEFQYRI